MSDGDEAIEEAPIVPNVEEEEADPGLELPLLPTLLPRFTGAGLPPPRVTGAALPPARVVTCSTAAI